MESFFAAHSDQQLELFNGYVAGVNRYLVQTGEDGLAQDCRDEDWVRSITLTDLGKVIRKLILYASTDQLAVAAATAEPPIQSMAQLSPRQSLPFMLPGLDLMPDPSAFASNAYGIGSEASQTGHGMLLGNPHFPWSGHRRFYMHHLTIPGELDVMGVTLTGMPAVLIGFNKDVAWSHTVSTGRRFAIYELELLEDDPMKYKYDDEVREIRPVPVTIEVMLADGTLEQRTKNLYESHYGLVIDAGVLSPILGGWPTGFGSVLSFRDANLGNTRGSAYWEALDKAASIDDVEEAARMVGNPWTNIVAADRDGEAFYGDITVLPHITAEQAEACNVSTVTNQISNAGVPALNGSDSACEWGSDPSSPQDAIFGYDSLPKLRTRKYVGNSNDSYWLSNPDMRLTGFPPVIGKQEVPQSLRTRLGFLQAEARMDASDGKDATPGFTIELLQDMLFSNEDLAQQLVRTDVVSICRDISDWTMGECATSTAELRSYSDNPSEAAAVCAILEGWDGTYDLDAVGAAVWKEFWLAVGRTDNLWAVEFDPADPLHTPRELNDTDPAIVEAVRCGLGGAVDTLVAAGIPLDRPWGETQFRWNGDLGHDGAVLDEGLARPALLPRRREGAGAVHTRGEQLRRIVRPTVSALTFAPRIPVLQRRPAVRKRSQTTCPSRSYGRRAAAG